jgi:hypothetical protein
MSEEKSELISALAKVLPMVGGVKKNSRNPHFKSKYADLSNIIEAIRPLANEGVWYRQALRQCTGGVEVETFYIGFGQEISAGTLFMPADRGNAQGYGSALTYARRYALQTAFGLAAEDDDGNAASKQPSNLISKEQCEELNALIKVSGSEPLKFNQAFGVLGVAQLPAARFEEAKQALNRKIKTQKG